MTTILTAKLPLAKTWHADGTVTPYAHAKHFTHQQVQIDNLEALHELLGALAADPYSCLVRGRVASGDRTIVRQKGVIEDQPLSWLLIDVDGYVPMTAGPLEEDAIVEFVQTELPPEFRGAAYSWRFSGSAGMKDDGGLRAHLWFWLAEPATSAQLRAWAKRTGLKSDCTLFDSIQIHYTADPLRDEGVADPFAGGVRSGFVAGGTVALAMSGSDLRAVERLTLLDQKRLKDQVNDPVVKWLVEHWEVKEMDSEGRVHVRCPWEREHGSGAGGETSSTYIPAGVGGIVEPGYACLHDSCRDKHNVRDFLIAVGYDKVADDFGVVAGDADKEVPAPAPVFVGGRDKAGRIECNMANVVAALRSPDFCGARLSFDRFLQQALIEWVKEGGGMRPIEDADATILETRLVKRGFKAVAKRMVVEAMNLVCREHGMDSAVNWLSGLRWDGVERVEGFLERYLGCSDSEYGRAVGRYLWTALAGRALASVEPVKVDMVPVMVGAQGTRKSTAVRVMAPAKEMSVDISLDEREDDIIRRMMGRLTIELGELRGMTRKDAAALKGLITRDVDTWVPKYSNLTRSQCRRGVLIGTTNEDDFLHDDTGERRWLPFMVGMIDTAAIERDRDQLWAEGVARYMEHGVEQADAERLAREVHGDFKAHGTVEEMLDGLDGWLAADDFGMPRNDFTGSEAMQGACEVSGVKQENKLFWALARGLRKRGFRQAMKKIEGAPRRVWRKQ